MTAVADFVILLMTFIGASSTVAAEKLLRSATPATLLFLRFASAGVIIFMLRWKEICSTFFGSLRGGVTIGAGFGLGCIFLYTGLPHVHTGHAMFLLSLEVVLVPLFSFMLFRVKPSLQELIAFLVAVAGLWIFTGPHEGCFSKYDTIILLSACSYTIYTLALSRFTSREHFIGQIFIAYLFISVASGTFLVATEPVRIPSWSKLDLCVFAYFILVSTIVRFLGQSWAQRIASPTRTALIFLVEPLFSLLLSGYFYGERFPQQKIIGGAVLLTASLLATLTLKKNITLEV